MALLADEVCKNSPYSGKLRARQASGIDASSDLAKPLASNKSRRSRATQVEIIGLGHMGAGMVRRRSPPGQSCKRRDFSAEPGVVFDRCLAAMTDFPKPSPCSSHLAFKPSLDQVLVADCFSSAPLVGERRFRRTRPVEPHLRVDRRIEDRDATPADRWPAPSSGRTGAPPRSARS